MSTDAKKFSKGKPAYQFIDWRVFDGSYPISQQAEEYLRAWTRNGRECNVQAAFHAVSRVYGTHHHVHVARIELARALAHGDEKYGAVQYRRGLKWSDLWRAAYGHIQEHRAGNLYDEESGLMHLSHALGALMMLYVHQLDGLGEDDREAVWP